MRKLLIVLGVAAVAAMLMPSGAEARAGGPRSGAARFAPPPHGSNIRLRFNRELVQRLRLRCPRTGRAVGSGRARRCVY